MSKAVDIGGGGGGVYICGSGGLMYGWTHFVCDVVYVCVCVCKLTPHTKFL